MNWYEYKSGTDIAELNVPEGFAPPNSISIADENGEYVIFKLVDSE